LIKLNQTFALFRNISDLIKFYRADSAKLHYNYN